jgi:hypothetical protein
MYLKALFFTFKLSLIDFLGEHKGTGVMMSQYTCQDWEVLVVEEARILHIVHRLLTDSMADDFDLMRKTCGDTLKRSLLRSPIDLQVVKERFRRSYTSTILGKEESRLFWRPSSQGFYGFYTFISRGEDNKGELVAEIVVFCDEYPWMYDTKNEVLIELRVYTGDITLYGGVRVGMSAEELRKLLGSPDLETSDKWLYHDGDKTVAIFSISDGKVAKIRIGRYNIDPKLQGNLMRIMEER